MVLGQAWQRWHVPQRWRCRPGWVTQRWRLTADEQQVIGRRVGAEAGAMVLKERAGCSHVGVERQGCQGVELDVVARTLMGQPSPVGMSIVRLIARGRISRGRSTSGDVAAESGHRTEVVIGGVVLLDHDDDVLDSRTWHLAVSPRRDVIDADPP